MIRAGRVNRQPAEERHPVAATRADVVAGRSGKSARAIGQPDVNLEADRQAIRGWAPEGIHRFKNRLPAEWKTGNGRTRLGGEGQRGCRPNDPERAAARRRSAAGQRRGRESLGTGLAEDQIVEARDSADIGHPRQCSCQVPRAAAERQSNPGVGERLPARAGGLNLHAGG